MKLPLVALALALAVVAMPGAASLTDDPCRLTALVPPALAETELDDAGSWGRGIDCPKIWCARLLSLVLAIFPFL